ncbi:hypothetical protein [Nocardia anaemiae]|uniref:hypothetical protein n=1 Tax=Nocardia anaemiae TaxID=263910 RepID=UPI0007A3C360|nr:hypothetical protein [Nocardia anaemiae]
MFVDALDYYADLYRSQSETLAQRLSDLEAILSDRRIIEVTRRFVRFHQTLYSHRYDDLAGDYAI